MRRMLRSVEHGFYLRETALQVESLLVTEKLCPSMWLQNIHFQKNVRSVFWSVEPGLENIHISKSRQNVFWSKEPGFYPHETVLTLHFVKTAKHHTFPQNVQSVFWSVEPELQNEQQMKYFLKCGVWILSAWNAAGTDFCGSFFQVIFL